MRMSPKFTMKLTLAMALLLGIQGGLWGATQQTSSEKPVREIEVNKPGLVLTAVSPDGKWLAMEWSGQSVLFYPLFTKDTDGLPSALGLPARSIAFSPDGKSLVVDADQTVALMQIDDTKEMQGLHLAWKRSPAQLGTDHFRYGPLTFSPDGRLIAFDYLAAIKLIRVSDGGVVRTIEKKGCSGERVTFSPDGKLLAADCGGTIKLIQVSDGEFFGRLWELNNRATSGSFTFSPDSRVIASTHGGDIQLFRVSDGSVIRVIDFGKYRLGLGGARRLAFSPDGTLLASGHHSGGIALWRVSDGGLVRKIKAHQGCDELGGDVDVLAFLPDGKLLSFSEEAGAIKLWQVY